MQSGFTASTKLSVAAMPTGGDRKQARAGVRTPHRVPCRVRWSEAESERSTSCVGQTVNISSTGLAVQLGRDVPVGTSVEALLPSLRGDPSFVRGTVSHCQRVLSGTFEIGIRCRDEDQASP